METSTKQEKRRNANLTLATPPPGGLSSTKRLTVAIPEIREEAKLSLNRGCGRKYVFKSHRALGHGWNIRMDRALGCVDNKTLKFDLGLTDQEPDVYAECSFFVKGERKGGAKRPMSFYDDNEFYVQDLIIAVDEFPSLCKEDGTTLEIEVEIQIEKKDLLWRPHASGSHERSVYPYPYRSESADVSFLVDGMEYPAHRFVLKTRAKQLFQWSESKSSIEIPGIRGTIFGEVLEFLYTLKPPPLTDIEATLEILVAADKLECQELKLYAEWKVVSDFLTVQNAARLWIWADGHHCALLEEAAMRKIAPIAGDASRLLISTDFKCSGLRKAAIKRIALKDPNIGSHSVTAPWAAIIKSERFGNALREFAVREAVTSVVDVFRLYDEGFAKGCHATDVLLPGTCVPAARYTKAFINPILMVDVEDWYRFWSVTMLRRGLEREGLVDLDGSREVLIQRLNEFLNPLFPARKKRRR